MSTKIAVTTISMIATDSRSKPPGECTPYPFDANPASCAVLKYPSVPLRVSASTPAPTMPPTTWAAMYGTALAGGCLRAMQHADGDGRVDVASRDPTDQVRHAQQAQAEGERHAEDADDGTGQTGRRRVGQPVRGKDRGARSPDDEDGGADALGEHHACGLVHVGSDRSMVWSVSWVMSSLLSMHHRRRWCHRDAMSPPRRDRGRCSSVRSGHERQPGNATARRRRRLRRRAAVARRSAVVLGLLPTCHLLGDDRR